MIRFAQADDLAEVLRIERSCGTAPHWPAAEYERIISGMSDVRRCLLLTEGGFAVGKAAGEDAELESVAVAPEARRRGVGRELCRAVIAWCEDQGAKTIGLEVRATSLGARRLYEGLGFVEIGMRPGYYAEPLDDAVVMSREG